MLKKKLYVVAPRPYLKWMQEYSTIEDYGFDRCVFLDCEDVENGTAPDLIALYHQLGIKSIQVVPVNHCLLSFGISITTNSGFKFTYSGLDITYIGDCRPSDDLIRIGKDSDLLIHEATFEDEKIEEAIQKNHSTVSEAIKTGELYFLLT
jgi:ribonuclease Z